MKRMLGTALALGMLAVAPAVAGDARQGDIQVTTAWARATPPRPPVGGAYLTVTNTGSQSDVLVGAESDVAKSVELHAHMKDGEVMRMAALSSIEVRPGQTVTFAPGGLHVMLIGLKAPLKEGTSFPLTLDFATAGKLTVTVDVKKIGAVGPGEKAGAAGAGSAAMAHDPAMHDQHMQDPAYRATHEQHMQDPEHRKMHDQMHGTGK